LDRKMKTANPKPEKTNPNIRPWLYLGLTLGATWLLEFLAAGIQPFASEIGSAIRRYLGGAMPQLVALLLLIARPGRAYHVDFCHRIVDPKHFQPIWWAVILLFMPLKSGLAALIDVIFGGWGIVPEGITDLPQQPLMSIPRLIFWLIFGPCRKSPAGAATL
jgi:hypothetical protein